jgi:hypothetical protein
MSFFCKKPDSSVKYLLIIVSNEFATAWFQVHFITVKFFITDNHCENIVHLNVLVLPKFSSYPMVSRGL